MNEAEVELLIQKIEAQYKKRIDYVSKSNKSEKEKNEEITQLLTNSMFDPRNPNVTYSSQERALKANRIAMRLDTIPDEDFLIADYVVNWNTDTPDVWVSNYKGDITNLYIDAIVNAANSTLLGGGGVDGAIHRRAGTELRNECYEIRQTRYPEGLPSGEAVITKGYNLPAKFVIHTVGPVYNGGNNGEPEILYNCYFNSLKVAVENKIDIIAFPNISTGAFRYPKDEANQIRMKAISDFVKENRGSIEEIILVEF